VVRFGGGAGLAGVGGGDEFDEVGDEEVAGDEEVEG
jgi:hypothetical protein